MFTSITIYYRPSGASSGYESVREAARCAEQVASNYRPDIIVLGEMLNVVGAQGTLDSKAETVLARALTSWPG